MSGLVEEPSLAEVLEGLPLRDHPLWLRATTIKRKSGLESAAFAREHLAGEGLPVVVVDAMQDWPARSRWSFDFFRQHYGDDDIVANLPMFLEPDLGLEPVQARMRLADYIDYIEDTRRAPTATYLRGDLETLRRNRLPLYAPVYRVLHRHPELAADVAGSSLPFIDDLFARLPLSVRRFLDRYGSPVHYLFFAPRNSVAFLHTDYWGTHAYLAQLHGRKLCVLFPPSDAANVYAGSVRNPFTVDPARFPLFEHARPHVAVLEAGQTAIIPSGWWHFVIGLEASLTYSYNFFTVHNMGSYFSHLFAVLAQALSEPADIDEELRTAIAELQRAAEAESA